MATEAAAVTPLPPAMWRHCSAVYEKMASEAQPSGDRIFWDGFTTHVFSELSIPVPYYGKVLKTLRLMGCIQQVRRGGSTTPSRWEITGEPTLEKFREVYDGATAGGRSALGDRLDRLEQKVGSMWDLLGGVNVPQALMDLRKELALLQEEESGPAA